MGKRLLCVALMVAAAASWAICARAEAAQVPSAAGMPADAEPVAEERFGDMRLVRLSSGTGETMVLLLDGTGMPACLITEEAAPVQPGASQTAEGAAAAAREAFPGALILRVAPEGELKAVSVVTPHLAGTLWTAGDRVVRRDLRGGSFIADGRLTLDGACRAAQLIHPEAVFTAIEYDDEDDTYEGEATVNGTGYELELDARTGTLLEWERD